MKLVDSTPIAFESYCKGLDYTRGKLDLAFSGAIAEYPLDLKEGWDMLREENPEFFKQYCELRLDGVGVEA